MSNGLAVCLAVEVLIVKFFLKLNCKGSGCPTSPAHASSSLVWPNSGSACFKNSQTRSSRVRGELYLTPYRDSYSHNILNFVNNLIKKWKEKKRFKKELRVYI